MRENTMGTVELSTVSLKLGVSFWCHLNSLRMMSTPVPRPRALMAVIRFLMMIGDWGVVWVVVIMPKDIPRCFFYGVTSAAHLEVP